MRESGTAMLPLARHAALHAPRAGRFALVGAIGVIVNTLVLFTLVEAAHVNHIVAAAIATEVAIFCNFQMNDSWTFRGEASGLRRLSRLARYNAIALGGMLITLGILAVLTSAFGLHYLIANLCAIATATAWNYLVNCRFTWRAGTPIQRRGRAMANARYGSEI